MQLFRVNGLQLISNLSFKHLYAFNGIADSLTVSTIHCFLDLNY